MNVLPIYINVVAVLLAALGGMAYGRRLFARGVRIAKDTRGGDAPVLAALGLLFIFGNAVFLLLRNLPMLAWYLPVFIDYHWISVGWMIDLAIIAFLFSAISTVLALQKSRLWWVAPLAGLAVLLAGETAIRNNPLLQPPTLFEARVDADGVVWQSHPCTCAAAAAANIARFYGVDVSEREMVKLLGTTADGTTPAQVYYGMKKLGFGVRKRRVHNIAELEYPAVLFIRMQQPLDHAVAYIGRNGTMATILDPAKGVRIMNDDDVSAVWDGYAMEIMPRNGTEA